MYKTSKKTTILHELEENCALMAAALHKGMEAEAVSAMAAALLSVGAYLDTILKTGATRSIQVISKNSLIIFRRTKNAVLMALAPADTKLDLIDFDMNSAINKIENIP